VIPFSQYIAAHLTAIPVALIARRDSSLAPGQAVYGLLLAALLVSVPSTYYWMERFPAETRHEGAFVQVLVHGARPATYQEEQEVAAYLAARALNGALILLDDFPGHPIIVFSGRPGAFITPSHSLFGKALRDPRAHKLAYVLVPDPGRAPGERDAINAAYPKLYLEGQPGFVLEKAFQSWKLFRVEGQA
jgi:hypothetical protein